MAQYTDEQILQANQGRISIGEYVIFKGNLVIKWESKDVDTVNIIYEKTQDGVSEDTIISENIASSSNMINTYTWHVPFYGNINYEYPTYRIKIISTISNNIVAYSNKFKVSINMTNIKNIKDLPLSKPNTKVIEQ